MAATVHHPRAGFGWWERASLLLHRSGDQPSHARRDPLTRVDEHQGAAFLDGGRVYSCAECRTHLTSHEQIISKSFHGRGGRAFLLNSVVNFSTGPAQERMLITGVHVVRDIKCNGCNQVIGWKYEDALESSQRYKIGKFIVEKVRMYEEKA